MALAKHWIEMTGQSEMMFDPSAAVVALQRKMASVEMIAARNPGFGQFADSRRGIQYTVAAAAAAADL